MSFSERIINSLVSLFFRLTCQVEFKGMENIPATGPAILIANHTSSLEGPLFYVSLRPRPAVALAKKELWDSLPSRLAMEAWGSIPLDREGIDTVAIRSCFRVLEEGHFLCIAPEGTRSKTGELKRAMPGTVVLASRTGVPVYPMVLWGLRDLTTNLLHLKRTKVQFRAGKPFVIEKEGGGKFTAEDRKKVADEMMYHLAELLPRGLRGYYSDESERTSEFIRML